MVRGFSHRNEAINESNRLRKISKRELLLDRVSVERPSWQRREAARNFFPRECAHYISSCEAGSAHQNAPNRCGSVSSSIGSFRLSSRALATSSAVNGAK